MNHFDDLLERARDLLKMFAEQDAKPWPTSAKVLDLADHVGKLAEIVLEREGYKHTHNGVKLSRQLAVISFIIFDIAEENEIDIKKEFRELLEIIEHQARERRGEEHMYHDY